MEKRRILNQLMVKGLMWWWHREGLIEGNQQFLSVSAELRGPCGDIRHKSQLVLGSNQQIAGSPVLDLNSIKGQGQSTPGVRGRADRRDLRIRNGPLGKARANDKRLRSRLVRLRITESKHQDKDADTHGVHPGNFKFAATTKGTTIPMRTEAPIHQSILAVYLMGSPLEPSL